MLCVNECVDPKKRAKRGKPYSRSVCILPFGHQTGQWGDCTSWHYCILVNEGPVLDPQTHWPSSVFYRSLWVQLSSVELLMTEAHVIFCGGPHSSRYRKLRKQTANADNTSKLRNFFTYLMTHSSINLMTHAQHLEKGCKYRRMQQEAHNTTKGDT